MIEMDKMARGGALSEGLRACMCTDPAQCAQRPLGHVPKHARRCGGGAPLEYQTQA